ncbi:T3SS_Flik_C domain containing protein [Burkholderiales bacterium]
MNASLDTLFQAPVLPDPVESASTSRVDSRPTTPRDGPDFRDTFSAVHQQQRAALDDQRERSEIADVRRKQDDGERPPQKSQGAGNDDEDAGTDLKSQRTKALAARGALREIPLGRAGTLLVAGDPPTDADLLDFAKAAGLPETAVAALLLGAGGAEGDDQPGLAGIPGAQAEWAALGLLAGGPGGAPSASPNPGLWAPTTPSTPAVATATGLEAAMRAALSGAGVDANGVATVAEGADGAEANTDLGAFVAHRIRVPVLDPQAAAVWSQRAEQSMAGEGIRLDPLVLRSVVFEKMAEAAAPMPTAADRLASLQAADLGASLPLDGPDADVDRIAGDLAAGGSSRLGGGALGSSTGDGGQGRQGNQQLAQRFGELMNQRLVQQIAQGNWKVNMDVHPRALGEIQIELQWKGGELEASFRASQLVTRDLLQEALPRLRETLERAGTDVASLTVGDSSRQKNGDQTGHNRNRNAQSAVQSGDAQPVAVVEGLTSRPTSSDGRLDVLV